MIKVDSKNRRTEVKISGDAETILMELHFIIAQLLKAYHKQGAEVLVLHELVDAIEEFKASITNKNFNSKGEKTND